MGKEISKKGHFAALTPRYARLLIMMLAVAMPLLSRAVTTYVTLNDGCVHVFPDSCVNSMDNDGTTLVFTAIDGQQFSYPVEEVGSISNTLQKLLPSIITYSFNNEYNYQVIGDAIGDIKGNHINATVIGIGKWLTAKFTLSDEEAMAWVNGVEQHSTVSRMKFATSRDYVVGFPGDLVLSATADGHYKMLPFGRKYIVTVDFLTDHSSIVPRIDINTKGGANIISKINYLDAQIIIDGAGVYPSMTDSVKVRGRGNTSWSANPAAKNPYRLKFASKVKPLGLSKGKNWVLLANKIYGSMLTNAYGMKAASLIGTAAVNHIIPVDLYVNGTYKGNYNFTEKVGLAGNSVDLDDEGAATLLELDRYYDEPAGQKFRSDPRDIPVNIKEPEFGEDLTVLTLEDIESRFNDFVSAVMNGEDLERHVDIDMLARYLLANELICNKEIFHPKSVYCYHENILDDDSKFVFGPMWDLDWACGYLMNYPNSYFMQLTTYDFFNSDYNGNQYDFFRAMSMDKKVSKRMYEIWTEFMGDGLEELCDYCQDYFDYAEQSLINSKAAYPDMIDYAEQASHAPSWFRARANLIYDRLKKDNSTPGDVDDDGDVTIADVSALIDYLLNNQDSTLNLINADLDDDGSVSIGDVSALIDMLLTGE